MHVLRKDECQTHETKPDMKIICQFILVYVVAQFNMRFINEKVIKILPGEANSYFRGLKDSHLKPHFLDVTY